MIVGRKPVLPPETVKALHEWAKFGRNVPEVARRLGVDPKTVWHYLHGKHKRKVA